MTEDRTPEEIAKSICPADCRGYITRDETTEINRKIAELARERERLEADRDRLAVALQPFARWSEFTSHGGVVWMDRPLTEAHYRDARRALEHSDNPNADPLRRLAELAQSYVETPYAEQGTHALLAALDEYWGTND